MGAVSALENWTIVHVNLLIQIFESIQTEDDITILDTNLIGKRHILRLEVWRFLLGRSEIQFEVYFRPFIDPIY